MAILSGCMQEDENNAKENDSKKWFRPAELCKMKILLLKTQILQLRKREPVQLTTKS